MRRRFAQGRLPVSFSAAVGRPLQNSLRTSSKCHTNEFARGSGPSLVYHRHRRRLHCCAATHDTSTSGSSSPSSSSGPSKSSSPTEIYVKALTNRAQRLSDDDGLSMPDAFNTLKVLIHQGFLLLPEQINTRSRLLLTLACTLVSKVLLIAVPYCFKRAVDTLTLTKAPSPYVLTLLSLCGLLKIAANALYDVRDPIFDPVGQRFARCISKQSFRKVLALGSSWYQSIAVGSVANVIERATWAVGNIFRLLVFRILPSIVEFILVLILFSIRGWWTSLIVMSFFFVVYIWWTISKAKGLGQRWSVVREISMETNGKLMDSLVNYETVGLFGNANYEAQRIDACLEASEQKLNNYSWHLASFNTVQDTIFLVGWTLTMVLTASATWNTGATIGDIVMVSALLQQLWGPLSAIGGQIGFLESTLVEFRKLTRLVETEPTVSDASGAKELVMTQGSIVFDNASFSYPESHNAQDNNVLDSSVQNSNDEIRSSNNGKCSSNGRSRVAISTISFKVPAGSTLAIVGETGSGKSTLLRLLQRLYNVDSGRIFIDGQDISQVTLSSLRDCITVISQETILFNDTIAYNIGYGRPGASMAEVTNAAKAAGVHNVILNMKNGYETTCGERGSSLSGGERQRIIAARAILKNGYIVVQDEATSALDSKTEAHVSEALKTFGRKKTCIIVAHRLSTVFRAEHIIVMKKGRIIEEGTHESLLRISNGVYKDMWDRQWGAVFGQAERNEKPLAH